MNEKSPIASWTKRWLRGIRLSVGRIERRIKSLPLLTVVVASFVLGMLVNTQGGEEGSNPLRPEADEVWFPTFGKRGPVALVAREKGCEPALGKVRSVGDSFLAVKVEQKDHSCTCLEALRVVGKRGPPFPACDAKAKVSYGVR